MLTDTHAHLTFPEFRDDLPGVLERAAAAGVNRVVTIGTTVESSRQAVELLLEAARTPDMPAQTRVLDCVLNLQRSVGPVPA